MARPLRSVAPALLALALVGCGGGEKDVVARAGDWTLGVDELVELVAPIPGIAANREALLEVADLWIDYTLLARAYAADSTLADVDLSPVVDERVDMERVAVYRQSHVQLDTALSEAELRAQYANDAVTDAQVRARHILLLIPDDATAEEVDSVGRLAESLRERIVEGGEDFADLAREYSQDPETADRGGDIGYIFAGEVLETIETVAFRLEPGEVSPPFFSQLGLHLLRVEGRRTPPLAEFRRWLQERRVEQAEGAVVRRLMEEADTQRTEGDVEWIRRIAAAPRQPLDSVPEDHALVTYGDGGSLTVADVRRFFLGRPVPFLVTAARASTEEVDRLVLGTLVQGDRLVAASQEAGVEVTAERRAQIRESAREDLVALVRRIGLRAEDASEDAVRAVVREALTRTLAGEQNVVPLGTYSYALWRTEGGETRSEGLAAALDELRSVRNLQPLV